MFKLFQKNKAAAATSQHNTKNPPSSSSVKRSLLSLEPRLMFDAAAAATASEVASEQVAQEQAEAAVSSDSAADGRTADEANSQGVLDAIATYNPGESRTEVVFVDPTVPNYQELLSGMDPNIEVIMLDGGQDGVEQMATTLSGRNGIDAIHLISHGSAGQLQLGTGMLNADSMSGEYADELATIQQSLSEQADILVYGCDFAEGDTGQAAVNLLAELTGADVQASTDLTGNISLGGDWDFEVSTGTIETALAIDYDAQMNWAGVLGTETVADTFSEKSFGNDDGTSSWSSNWSEVDVGKSDAKGGHIQVNSGELRIQTQMVGASVSRGVDLSRVNSAMLSFDYKNDIDKGGSVEIRISTDGGKSYKTLDGGTFSSSDNTGNGTAKFDISSYASADTKIQFVVTGTSGGDRLLVDNVQISYDAAVVNQAPTDLALSANTVAENATSGTVVGTISATDPDAGDTKTYSLTDTAGGRFAIDAITGVLTVADGSLLNYESAASHTVTVQVTDSGGQSYTETMDIHVTNVVETFVLSSNGTLHASDGPFENVVIKGGNVEIDGDIQIKGNLTITKAAQINGGLLSVTGDVTTTDTGYRGTAVIVLAGDGAQTISTGGGAGELRNVSIMNTSGAVRIAGALQLSGTYTDNGNAVDATGATVELQQNAQVSAAGTRFGDVTLNGRYLDLDSDIYVKGDLTINNLVRLNGGTIYVAGQIVENDQVWSGTGNIQPWVTNEAPTDLVLSATTVGENAASGTVVGTASGTDPDAGDTKTYSLTDSAGGRFAIDATTGVLTVADGSLLNYESAASHTVTVRVTDSGGLSYHETFTIQVSNVNEAPTVRLEKSTVDESLVSSLLINAGTTQSGASQTVDLPSDRDNDVTEAESYLPNDVPRAAEASTNPVSPVEPLTTGHHPTQDIQELVPIHGRNGQQAASSGESATTGATDSTKSPDATPQESGPWPWSQSDGVETAQNKSAELGLSMAVGLAGLAGQGRQGTKEKMMSVKAQLQALHQKNPSENTSQRADENAKKESVPEG